MRRASGMLALQWRGDIAAHGRQHRYRRVFAWSGSDLFPGGDERLYEMRRVDVVGLAVIHDPGEALPLEPLLIAHAPVVDRDVPVDEAAVAAREAGHLQQALRPQLRELPALQPAAMAEGEPGVKAKPPKVSTKVVAGASWLCRV